MSTLKVSTLQNLSGTEVYTCKAWVNFNGTGTVAIRAAGNVSSITDSGTGQYTVNFTTAMPDANYSVSMAQQQTAAAGTWGQMQVFSTVTVSQFSVTYGTYNAASFQDPPSAYIAVFR